MLDVDEHGWQASLGQLRSTRLKGCVAILFQPRDQQVVFDRDAAEERAVARLFRSGIGRRKHLAHFQTARRSADDPGTARVATAIGGGKTADAA